MIVGIPAMLNRGHEVRSAQCTVVATSFIRRNSQGSRGPSVVVMETAEHWNRDDLAGMVVVHGPIRDPLPNTLMRAGLVEIRTYCRATFSRCWSSRRSA